MDSERDKAYEKDHVMRLGRSIRWLVLVAAVLLATAFACSEVNEAGQGTTTESTETAPASTESEAVLATATGVDTTITVGDIDAEDPAKKIRRFQPLAEYLAREMQGLGVQTGNVVVARDFDEMARFMSDGTVDVYTDSAYPVLAVQMLAGVEIILRRWKDEEPTYWSTFIALRDSGVTSVDGFLGRVVAFEEPQSTSGFVLPAGTLIQRGFKLREVESVDAQVGPDEIGYVFSGDEENTVEMVLEGKVAGGGVSNQDYAELTPELVQSIAAFDETITVPRQLVAVRPGLDGELAAKVSELLIGLDRTDEGREIMDGMKKTKKFDPLPEDTELVLEKLTVLMDLVAGE